MGGSSDALAMPWWCGAGAEGTVPVAGCAVRGAGELGCLSAARGHCCAVHSSVRLVSSFGCLKHLSNTLGTAH